MQLEEKPYRMSFTTGALLLRESERVAMLYDEKRNWDEVRKEVIEKNLLQMRTTNSSKRILSEVTARLKSLPPVMLDQFIESEQADRQYILWLAVCKRYRFIADFAASVLYEKYVTWKELLGKEDFDLYFENKAEWHPEVARIRPATRKKLRQVLFRMLREAHLLTDDYSIIPAAPSPALMRAIHAETPRFFTVFPMAISV